MLVEAIRRFRAKYPKAAWTSPTELHHGYGGPSTKQIGILMREHIEWLRGRLQFSIEYDIPRRTVRFPRRMAP